MTNENVKPSNGSISEFIKTSVKRNMPTKLKIKDLFYLTNSEHDYYRPFYKENFVNYYNSLSSKFKLRLQYVFECIKENVLISCEVKTPHERSYLYLTISNQFEDKEWHVKVPHNMYLREFIFQYINCEISCEVTLDQIVKLLKLI